MIVFIILRLGDSLTFFNQDNSANFLVKKMCNEAIRGVSYLKIREKNFKLNVVLAVVLVLKSKGFYKKRGELLF